ncbi:MAG: PAS domain S-box protein [bacterium]
MINILIVDDNKQNLYLLATIFEKSGFNVVEAANGVEALVCARENPPDIIVSDILMPKMDGFALCREWMKDERLRKIPFIFFTATYTRQEDEDFAMSLGATRFMIKPIEHSELVATVQEVLKEKKIPRTPAIPPSIEEDATFYQVYNEALIRKLEDKMLQSEQTIIKLDAELAKQKRAEQVLESQYALLTALINSASDIIIFSLDINYCYTIFNEKHREEMKRVWNADINIGMNLLDCMQLPEFRALAKQSIDRALHGEAFSETQHQPDSDIYYEFSWNPIYQHEEIVGVTVFIRDITERKRAEEKILKASRIYAVISQINQAIVRVRDKERLFQEACRIAVEHGKFQMSWIGLVDEETKLVNTFTFAGIEDGYLSKIKKISVCDTPEGRGSTGAAIREGNHYVCNDIENDPKMAPWKDEALKRGYRSSIALPIKLFGKVIGAFSLYAPTSLFFDQEEIELLDEVINDISFALETIETEKKRQEAVEALRESDVRLNEAQRIGKMGSWEWDMVTQENRWSNNYYNILGLQPFEIEPSFEYFRSKIHPEDVHILDENHAHLFKNRKSFSLEVRLILTDGTIKWIQTNVVPVVEDDKIVQLKGVIIDITERKLAEQASKRAEEALHISEEKFAKAFRSSPDIIVLTSLAEGRLVEVNEKLYEATGYTQDEIIGKRTNELQFWADPAARDQYINILMRDGRVRNLEVKFRVKSGEIRDTLISGEIIELQDGKYILGVIHDVTERKRVEEALRKSEEKYRGIFENVQDVFYEAAIDGTILEVSPSIEVMSKGQYHRNDLFGKSMYDFYSNPGEREALLAVLQERGRVTDFEITLKNRDDSQIPCSISSKIQFDAQGHPKKIIGTLRDITERKVNENQKKYLEAQLQQAQKLESLGTLASGIAHDFNNILGIIIGHAALLERLPADCSTIQQNVEAIRKAAMRGANLVKQMLTFARKTDVLIESVTLNNVVNEVIKLLHETFPRTITIDLQLENDSPLIEADATQVHQVLLNLCVNARDAMPSGGTLTISTHTESGEALRDKYPRATDQEYVVLSVADSGTGIDEETQRRIFEPFFTTKERGKGTGLGLSLVFGIMESHNGFVSVKSDLGKGTTFQCCFPVPYKTLELTQVQERTTEEIPGGSETILVVEDEELLRELVKVILASEGYTVLTAGDGEEGLGAYQRHQKEIALVISDLGLPKFSGDELYRKLKALNPGLPMILASGFIEPGMKEQILKEGVKGFIQKPYNPNVVLRAIRNVLDNG